MNRTTGEEKEKNIGRLQALLKKSPAEQLAFLIEGIEDRGQHCDYAIVLGSILSVSEERAAWAAKLYHEGRIRHIIVSGGVSHELNGKEIKECDYMAQILLERGVPSEAMILEDESRTTRENMILSTLVLNRNTRLVGVDCVMIITSEWHLKRSLALARCFLPRKLTVIGSGVPCPCDRDVWLAEPWRTHESNAARVEKEIGVMKGLLQDEVVAASDIFVE